MQNNQLLNQTISDIFVGHNRLLPETKQLRIKNRKAPKKELELACAVLLVDLASCDENFDMPEYHVIVNGLMRTFGTGKTEVSALIHRAKAALSNLRGTSSFANLLKENLSEDQRKALGEIIEDLINADGVVAGFEVYLKNKYADLLGIQFK